MNDTIMTAFLHPHYYKHYSDEEEKMKVVNGVVDYGIDLYNGISRNNGYCFGRTFNYSLDLSHNAFTISRNCTNELEKQAFLVFISLLEFLFIDEEIYLQGVISDVDDNPGEQRNTCNSQPLSLGESDSSLIIHVSKKIADDFSAFCVNPSTDDYCLSFISNTYRYKPFKDTEGNMIRHIATPLKKSIGEMKQYDKLEPIISLCNAYAEEKSFDKARV